MSIQKNETKEELKSRLKELTKPIVLNDSEINWDETLLTTAFEDQIKLLEKSIQGDNKNVTSKKLAQGKQNDKKKGKPSKAQSCEKQEKKSSYVITNSSRKFRYQPDDDQQINASSSIKGDFITSIEQDGLIAPPPFEASSIPKIGNEDEARASMLMSWYMAGYHTGYYQAMQELKK